MDSDVLLELSMEAARVAKSLYPGYKFDELVSEAWLIINNYLQTYEGLGDIDNLSAYFAKAVLNKLYKENKATWVWDESDYTDIPDKPAGEASPEQEFGPALGSIRNRQERAIYGLGLVPGVLEADVKEAIVLGYALVKGREPPKKRYRPKVRELAEYYKRLYFYNPRT